MFRFISPFIVAHWGFEPLSVLFPDATPRLRANYIWCVFIYMLTTPVSAIKTGLSTVE